MTKQIGERWKAVEGYEGIYEVSDLGRVRSLDRTIAYKKSGNATRKGVVLAGGLDRKGYRRVILCKRGKQRGVYISRLVAKAFVPNPDNLPEVHHKDFNQANDVAINLEWTTHQQNIARSVIRHRYAKKLTSAIVSEIRTRATNGESQTSIARSLGLRTEAVHQIVNRRSWRHI